MTEINQELVTFESKKIRKEWHNEKWYFSIVDVVSVLIEKDYQTARKYWNKLSERLKKEGANESVTKCHQLKMVAADGKRYKTDAADIETLFRIIQSIPSPKAEPMKRWLAKVGYERLQEYENPSLAVDRARSYYKKLGRSEEWIQQRLLGQTTRNELTNYWSEHEIKEGKEYAILTDIIHKEWSEMTVQEHKKLKNLDRQNLRDHMTTAELVFTALAELSTKQLAEKGNAIGLKENKIAAKAGGNIAKKARKELEQQTGTKVISSDNFLKKKAEIEEREGV